MIEYVVEILLFVICVLLTAFFSSSEVALISITRAKVRTLVNEGLPGSDAVAALKESPEHLLITILIGNTVVTTASASIATAVAIQMFGDMGVGIATLYTAMTSLETAPALKATTRSSQAPGLMKFTARAATIRSTRATGTTGFTAMPGQT